MNRPRRPLLKQFEMGERRGVSPTRGSWARRAHASRIAGSPIDHASGSRGLVAMYASTSSLASRSPSPVCSRWILIASIFFP